MMTKSLYFLKRPRIGVGLIHPAVSAQPPILTLLISVLPGIKQGRLLAGPLFVFRGFNFWLMFLRMCLIAKLSPAHPRFISLSLWVSISYKTYLCGNTNSSSGYCENQRPELHFNNYKLAHRCQVLLFIYRVALWLSLQLLESDHLDSNFYSVQRCVTLHRIINLSEPLFLYYQMRIIIIPS